MSSLKKFKKIYDKLGNDCLRSIIMSTAERLNIRKDVIRMDINNYCNIQCIMCNKADSNSKKHFMSIDDFKKVIDTFAPSTRMFYLSCGYEPLVTPHFTEYLKYIKSKGIPHISFCTNALLLSHDIIDCLVKYEIDEIIISFNGFIEEDYNRIMTGSDFNRVCNNIKALGEFKKKHKVMKPHIRLNTILLKSNFLQFDCMYDFLLDNDIDTIQFRELVMYDDQNDPDEVKKELLSNLSKKQYEKIALQMNEMANHLHEIGKEVIIPSAFKNFSVQQFDHTMCSGADVSIQKKNNLRKKSCSIPSFSYWINNQGNVRVCGYDKNAIIGNALDQNFNLMKIKRKNFRKKALSGKCDCESCTINVDSSTIM